MEVIIVITTIIVTRWVEAKQGEEVKCLTLWTPLTDQGQEGVFKSLVSGNIHSDLAWGPGQPNGDTTENSVRMMTESELLEDVDSTKSDCFVCRLKKSFAAQLRGGCKAAKLERLMLRIRGDLKLNLSKNLVFVPTEGGGSANPKFLFNFSKGVFVAIWQGFPSPNQQNHQKCDFSMKK